MIASYIPNVYNGVSVRTAFSDGRHELIVMVGIEDEVVRKVIMQVMRSAVGVHDGFHSEYRIRSSMTLGEFDVMRILLRVRLPPRTHACNWCFGKGLVSFGIAQTNTSLRLVCSNTAVALVK